MTRIVAGNRHPYMGDQPRARFVEQSQSLARGKWTSIRICSAAVITGGAVLNVIFGLGQGGEPTGGILWEEWAGKKATYD
jgi:hypothetical protein